MDFWVVRGLTEATWCDKPSRLGRFVAGHYDETLLVWLSVIWLTSFWRVGAEAQVAGRGPVPIGCTGDAQELEPLEWVLR